MQRTPCNMQQTTWSRQHARDNMQQTSFGTQRAAHKMQTNVKQPKCSGRRAADNSAAEQTCGGRQRSRDNMRQTQCSRDNMRQTQCGRDNVRQTTVRRTTVRQRQRAAENIQAANGSVSGSEAGGSDMCAVGGVPRRRNLLRLPGRRRLRHTDTACGTRVRACVPPKLATCSRQPTTGRPDLQHATNRTRRSHRAGRSDHARVGTSAHPKANRTDATRADRERAAGNAQQRLTLQRTRLP